MLEIKVPGRELYDETRNLFITTHDTKLTLEHSLISLSKWESKWCKPFLSKESKTTEQVIDYIRCMTLTQNVDPNVFKCFDPLSIKKINEYIEAPMTATWFSEKNNKTPSREIITSELIYYWMIALGIPFECQKWHLNRLLTLIRVCSIKNQPPKKMSTKDILSRNTSLNAARRAVLKSKG